MIFRKRGIDNNHFEGKREFIQRVHEVMELARIKFENFNLQELPIVFYKTGTHAGQALKRGNKYNVEFNTVAIKNDWNHMLNETIPHEIAHIVDMYIHGKSNHGPTWKYIARQLGCSGNRCHKIDMTDSKRKPKTRRRAVYIATNGLEAKLTMHMHNKIQIRNAIYRLKGGGLLKSSGFTGNIIKI